MSGAVKWRDRRTTNHYGRLPKMFRFELNLLRLYRFAKNETYLFVRRSGPPASIRDGVVYYPESFGVIFTRYRISNVHVLKRITYA